jgi:hypothetical protein
MIKLVIPIEQYNPDEYTNPEEKDNTLLQLIQFLNEIKNDEDVRDVLIDNFNLRQIAISSKLI